MKISHYIFQVASWARLNKKFYSFIIKATSPLRIMNPDYKIFIANENVEQVMVKTLYLVSKDFLSVDLVFDDNCFGAKFQILVLRRAEQSIRRANGSPMD